MLKILGNTSKKLIVSIDHADNVMSIYLNPDNGLSMKLFETVNSYDPKIGVTIDLESYLNQFANQGTVIMAVLMSNFKGPGRHRYTISGEGMPKPLKEKIDVPSWDSEMMTYEINV